MTAWLDRAVQNVVDGNGVPVSAAAMVIVFLSLSLISLFIAALPHILRGVEKIFPAEKQPVTPVDPSVIAAIACVLRKRKYGNGNGHSA